MENLTCPSTPKQVVQLLVNEQSPRIMFLNAEDVLTTRKSDVWHTFYCLALDGIPIDYVSCKHCKVVMGHKSRGGTSGLRHHKCASLRSTENTNSPNTTSVDITTTSTVTTTTAATNGDTKVKPDPGLPPSQLKPMPVLPGFPMDVSAKLKEDCIRFVAKDIRPYDITQGDGFRRLAQMFILIGVHYGNVDVSSILPDPSLIKVSLSQVADQIRERMMEELQACHHVALSTDVWSDSANGNFYTTVSGHYFLEDCYQLNLKTRILTTMRITDPKSSDVAWEVIENVIDQYSLEKDKITIVTDNEDLRKMIKGSKHITAIPSALGCLNTIVNKVLFNKDQVQINKLLEAVNKLIHQIKENKTDTHLCLQLEENIASHWGGMMTKMSFLKNNWDHLSQEIMVEDKHWLSDIDMELMTTVMDFLQPFKEAFEQLCDDSEPVLHLVIPWLHQLKTFCEEEDGDCNTLKDLKASASKLLESNFQIDDLYTVATALNPRMKGLGFLPSQQRYRTHETLRQLVHATEDGPGNKVINQGSNHDLPPEKKPKLKNLESLCDIVDESEVDEVNLYLQQTVLKIDSVTPFWEEHRNRYPKLFKVVLQVLCLPASASASDRFFNSRSSIIVNRRSNLSPASVDNILVLQSISDYL